MDKSAAPPEGLWARIGKWWRDFFWLRDIFALEFGTSDVQSNYSRVYAWMANQLGHMTLGLAVALLFVWIVETSQSAIIKFTDMTGAANAADLVCQWGDSCVPGNLLLGFTFAVVLGGLAAFLLWRAWTLAREIPPPGAMRTPYPPIPNVLAALSHAGVALALVGVATYALFFVPDGAAAEPWAKLTGTIIATLVIAAGVVTLCKDAQVLFLSLFGLLIVFVLGSEVAPTASPIADLRWEVIIIAALMCGVAVATYVLRYTGDDYVYLRKSGANWLREIAGGIFAASFLVIFVSDLDPEWREALTAAFASVTLWWVKEFGSDIPGVHDEIGRARTNRPAPLPGSESDYEQVELDYLTDARMDARTDGLFYIAGAWIGAGVISTVPVLSDNSWETGAELVGCLIFIFIFMVEGRRWSFRQVALDRMGANRASRLAVFRSAIRMVVIEPETEIYLGGAPEENLDYHPTPIDALDRFARGDQDDSAQPLDHVFVFGAPGAGRTPLGLALASEASLACHSTANDGGAPQREQRTGRYLRLNHLEYVLKDVKERTQLQAHPPQPVWFHKQTDKIRPPGSLNTTDYEREDAASLVIIDDVALEGGTTAWEACKRLNLQGGAQQTVWMFPTGDTPDAATMTDMEPQQEWRPDYRLYDRQIGPTCDAINKAAGAPQRIGIVFVRRYVAGQQDANE